MTNVFEQDSNCGLLSIEATTPSIGPQPFKLFEHSSRYPEVFKVARTKYQVNFRFTLQLYCEWVRFL